MHSIRQFELVRMLARHRHFGRAAAELGVSQPSLTRSLQQIEEALGVRLFDRDGAVAPTIFGELLIERGETILSTYHEMMREIASLKGVESGALKIAAGPYPSSIAVERAIGMMSQRYPNLLIELCIKNWPYVYRDVIAGAADVGVADLQHVADRPELEAEPVRRSQLTFFCRSGHPLLSRTSISPADVLEYPWVGPSVPKRVEVPDRQLPYGVFDANTKGMRPRILVETFSAALRVVKTGDALSAALPFQIRREIEDGSCHLLPVTAPGLELNYGFITRTGRTIMPAVAAFKEVLRQADAEAGA